MKNLKWFLGLAFALTFFAWQTPAVLAADDVKTNLETAIERLKNALTLLAKDDSLTQSSDNFGYYVPAWERGAVLGDTVTCQTPSNGCPSGATWNQTNCACEGGASQPNNGTIFCNSLGAYSTPEACNEADKAKQPTNQGMNCPPCAPNFHYENGSANSCGPCISDNGSQQYMPQSPNQNNFTPCPSGQVYLCAGNKNPNSTNGQMTCADGSTPFCGTLSNNQQINCKPFNYCNGRVVKENGCDVCKPADNQYQDQNKQPTTCPQFNNCNGKIIEKNGCKYCESNNQQNQNQDWNLVDAEEEQNNQGMMFNWPDLYRQASQMKTEASKVLKQVKKNDDLSKIIETLNGYLKEIKAATTAEAKSALDEKYAEVDLYEEFNGYRETMNNIRAKYDYEREAARITKEYDKAVKLIPKVKAPKYVKIDFPGLKSLLDDYGKTLLSAKDLVASGDYEEARNTIMEANNEKSAMDIYCVVQAVGDFDKNIALVKNATIRNSLLNDIINPIFEGAEMDVRGTCQFINNGNGNANTRNTIMTLINNARNITKMSSSLNKKFSDLEKKINSFNITTEDNNTESDL